MDKQILKAISNLEKKVVDLYYKVKGAVGVMGPQGPIGPQGVAGTQGAAGPVGPAGLTWRSTWSAGTAYLKDDAVGYNGASYFRRVSGTTAGLPNVDTTNWALLASQGAVGPQGAQGPTGAQGAAGTVPVKTKGQLYGSSTNYSDFTLLTYDINTIFNGSESSFFKLPNVTVPGKEIIVDTFASQRCQIYGFNLGLAFETSINSTGSVVDAYNNDLIKFTSIGANYWIVEYLIRTPIVIPSPVIKVQKTTLTLTQVQNLFTTPITVLSQTTGKSKFVTSIYIVKASTTPYVLANDYFDIVTGSAISANIPCAIFNYTGAAFVTSGLIHQANGVALNEGDFKLKALVGNPTGGTGGLDVYVTYTEITL